LFGKADGWESIHSQRSITKHFETHKANSLTLNENWNSSLTFVKRQWEKREAHEVARELCFRIMISTEKQWSVYIWNRCAVMEDHTSDSSPEISKVNWILNFSQERHIVQMALTGRNLSLYPHSSSIFFLFIQIFFYIHRWNKKSCRVSLCRLFDIRCAFFLRARTPE